MGSPLGLDMKLLAWDLAWLRLAMESKQVEEDETHDQVRRCELKWRPSRVFRFAFDSCLCSRTCQILPRCERLPDVAGRVNQETHVDGDVERQRVGDAVRRSACDSLQKAVAFGMEAQTWPTRLMGEKSEE